MLVKLNHHCCRVYASICGFLFGAVSSFSSTQKLMLAIECVGNQIFIVANGVGL